MSFWVGIIGFILVLNLVVVVHEAGHYLMARRYGMKVEEFFVGFGPKVFSWRRGETEYGLKWILLGGYVKIAGMDPYKEVPPEDIDRVYGAKAVRHRAITILAGPLSHFVMAFLVLWVYLAFLGEPATYRATIEAVEPKLEEAISPAAEAGLRPGDVVLAVNGQIVDREGFVEATRASVPEGEENGEPMTLTIRRGEQTLTVETTAVVAPGQDGTEVARLGVFLGDEVATRDALGPILAVPAAAGEVVELTELSIQGVARAFGPEGIGRVGELLFGDAERTPNDVMSTVGIARVAGEGAQDGNVDVLVLLFVGLNVFVGLLNLLPLPPFDGGHLAVLVIEKIRRKPVDMRKLIPVSAVVLTFFLLYMSAVIFLDLTDPLRLQP